MTADFFSRQNVARSKSRTFFAAFVLVIVLAVIILYFALTACLMIATAGLDKGRHYGHRPPENSREALLAGLPTGIYGSPQKVLSPQPFFIMGTLITATILFVSWRRTRAIKEGGGAYVAEVMGGVLLDAPKNQKEKTLVNVVEEMAVASGLPRPRIYIFPNEISINAVTAGLDHDDAIIAVTRGALTHLNRDELQGVVAHEFAHILNGDYTLNMTMAGWLFGLLFFSVKGRELLSLVGHVTDAFGDYDGRGVIGLLIYLVPAVLIGLILLIGGSIGKLAAELIQAATSRQREQLADAFAVQFTRNPAGITGALKKIAGFPRHGIMRNAQALMMKSFFIASPVKMQGLWRTHPPLADRIWALEPAWDGKVTTIDLPEPSVRYRSSILGRDGLGATAGGQRRLMETAEKLPVSWPGALVLALLAAGGGGSGQNRLSQQGLSAAAGLYGDIPDKLRKAAAEPAFTAPLIAAVFFLPDPALKAVQNKIIHHGLGPEAAGWATAFQILMEDSFRLPLLSLATPALKSFSADQRLRLAQTVKELIAADGKLDLFEIAAWQILKKHLGLAGPKLYSYKNGISGFMEAVQKDAVTVVSIMAHIGSNSSEGSEASFSAGMSHFNQWPPFELLPAEVATSRELAQALDRLGGALEKIKNLLVMATVATALHDHQVDQKEYELLRALAAALNVPLPLVKLD